MSSSTESGETALHNEFEQDLAKCTTYGTSNECKVLCGERRHVRREERERERGGTSIILMPYGTILEILAL